MILLMNDIFVCSKWNYEAENNYTWVMHVVMLNCITKETKQRKKKILLSRKKKKKKKKKSYNPSSLWHRNSRTYEPFGKMVGIGVLYVGVEVL